MNTSTAIKSLETSTVFDSLRRLTKPLNEDGGFLVEVDTFHSHVSADRYSTNRVQQAYEYDHTAGAMFNGRPIGGLVLGEDDDAEQFLISGYNTMFAMIEFIVHGYSYARQMFDPSDIDPEVESSSVTFANLTEDKQNSILDTPMILTVIKVDRNSEDAAELFRAYNML